MARPRSESPYRELALDAIAEPSTAMRETFDEARLGDLTESIAQIGVVLPIKVKPSGDKFEIVDGHRRYIAALRAGKRTIPAVISSATGIAAETEKIHANTFREDVNPAEEANYLNHLLEEFCGGDVDKLCELTRQRRQRVEDRLLLLKSDPEILAAVRDGRMGITVARELQRGQDRATRLMFLDAALKGGATARMVREWVAKASLIASVPAPDPGDGRNQFTGAPAPITTLICFVCKSDEHPWDLELLYVHRRLCRIFLDRFLEGLHGQHRQEASPQPGAP